MLFPAQQLLDLNQESVGSALQHHASILDQEEQATGLGSFFSDQIMPWNNAQLSLKGLYNIIDFSYIFASGNSAIIADVFFVRPCASCEQVRNVILEFTALAMAFVLIAIIFIPTLITGSSPVPTSPSVRATIMRVLPTRLPDPQGSRIYDLGSGWGGMAITLAKKYPDREVVGIEVSPLPWLVSTLRQMVFRQKNLKFMYGDFGRCDLSDAALVLCYLLPKPMVHLQEKLEKDLRAGSLIVSNTFAFHSWRPLDDQMAEDIYSSHVYLYEAGNVAK